jgi:hypothetical protein
VKDLSVRRSKAASGEFVERRPHSCGLSARIAAIVCVLAISTIAHTLHAQDDQPETTITGESPDNEDTGFGLSDDSETDDRNVDPSALPEGFEPQSNPPAVSTIEKELLTTQDEEALRKRLKIKGIDGVLRKAELDSTTRPIVSDLARYHVHRLTMSRYRHNLAKVRHSLNLDIRKAGSTQTNATTRRTFRQFLLQEVVNRCTELLDGNRAVRINAVIVLGNLNLVEEDRAKGVRAVAFAPAMLPLLKVLQDPDQPSDVKICAVVSVLHITALGDLDKGQELTIAELLATELKNKESYWWYQWRLAEALGYIDVAVDGENKPFIIQTLAEIMMDPKRHWIVRAGAARALGRARMNAGVNLRKVVYEIAQLAHDMAIAYNENPEQSYWKSCFWDVYLAFKPLNDQERQDFQAGLLTRYAADAYVKGAYDQVVALAESVLKPGMQEIPDKNLASLDAWLKKNRPDNQRIAPGLPPLSRIQAEEARHALSR